MSNIIHLGMCEVQPRPTGGGGGYLDLLRQLKGPCAADLALHRGPGDESAPPLKSNTHSSLNFTSDTNLPLSYSSRLSGQAILHAFPSDRVRVAILAGPLRALRLPWKSLSQGQWTKEWEPRGVISSLVSVTSYWLTPANALSGITLVSFFPIHDMTVKLNKKAKLKYSSPISHP